MHHRDPLLPIPRGQRIHRLQKGLNRRNWNHRLLRLRIRCHNLQGDRNLGHRHLHQAHNFPALHYMLGFALNRGSLIRLFPLSFCFLCQP